MVLAFALAYSRGRWPTSAREAYITMVKVNGQIWSIWMISCWARTSQWHGSRTEKQNCNHVWLAFGISEVPRSPSGTPAPHLPLDFAPIHGACGHQPGLYPTWDQAAKESSYEVHCAGHCATGVLHNRRKFTNDQRSRHIFRCISSEHIWTMVGVYHQYQRCWFINDRCILEKKRQQLWGDTAGMQHMLASALASA